MLIRLRVFGRQISNIFIFLAGKQSRLVSHNKWELGIILYSQELTNPSEVSSLNQMEVYKFWEFLTENPLSH